MKLRQALKIRKALMRRTLSRYDWEGSDRPMPRQNSVESAARRLRKIHRFYWHEMNMTFNYEKAQYA